MVCGDDDDDDVKSECGILVVLYSLAFQEMEGLSAGKNLQTRNGEVEAKRCRFKQGWRPKIRYEM